MKATHLAPLLFGLWPAGAAWAEAPSCGVDCARPGRVVLCNDSLLFGTPNQAVDCSTALGSCAGERYCSSFALPPGVSSTSLRNIYAVLGPAQGTDNAFFLEVYAESNAPTPGAQISPTATNSYALIGDPGAFQQLDLATLGNDYPLSSAFRVCFRKDASGSHNVCLDTSAASPGKNWMQAGVGSCSNPTGVDWFPASRFGVGGDFLIRAEIEVSDLGPWNAGGLCDRPDGGALDALPADAVAEDATGAVDAVMEDAGSDAGQADTAVLDAVAAMDQGAGVTDALGGVDSGARPDAGMTQDALPGADAATAGPAGSGCSCSSGPPGGDALSEAIAPSGGFTPPITGPDASALALVLCWIWRRKKHAHAR